MNKIKKPKGTQDFLPDDCINWRKIESTVHEVMRRYGYGEIRTPIFEYTNLFARGIGQLTDIVTKEMYTFPDSSRKSITLKPEGTAPVMRAYLENTLGERRQVNKLYYITSMFRQERPQAGRFRQFHQFGAELIGSQAPEADAETILLALDIYRELGLRNFVIKINSVGDADSRQAYKAALHSYFAPHQDSFDKITSERFEHNPLRLLDSKDPALSALADKAPKMVDYLSEPAREHFERVQTLLRAQDVSFEIDHRLVRGLDYYTYTAYEIIGGALGAQNALGGGGRYDLLAEELGGKNTPAVGFAAGIERLIIALQAENLLPQNQQGVDIFIATPGDAARDQAGLLARKLRSEGLSTLTDLLGRSLKAQMREANRCGARYALILGEDEIKKGKASLKDLAQSEQIEVGLDAVSAVIRERLQP